VSPCLQSKLVHWEVAQYLSHKAPCLICLVSEVHIQQILVTMLANLLALSRPVSLLENCHCAVLWLPAISSMLIWRIIEALQPQEQIHQHRAVHKRQSRLQFKQCKKRLGWSCRLQLFREQQKRGGRAASKHLSLLGVWDKSSTFESTSSR
jgi:hypothetical protein